MYILHTQSGATEYPSRNVYVSVQQLAFEAFELDFSIRRRARASAGAYILCAFLAAWYNHWYSKCLHIWGRLLLRARLTKGVRVFRGGRAKAFLLAQTLTALRLGPFALPGRDVDTMPTQKVRLPEQSDRYNAHRFRKGECVKRLLASSPRSARPGAAACSYMVTTNFSVSPSISRQPRKRRHLEVAKEEEQVRQQDRPLAARQR